MLRARLPLSRVLVSCSCVPISCFFAPSMRRPASLFIDEGKARVIEEKKEKDKREEDFQDRRVLLLQAGPVDPVDVNRDGSMSRPYSSLAPYAGVICRSWRSTPSRWTSR